MQILWFGVARSAIVAPPADALTSNHNILLSVSIDEIPDNYSICRGAPLSAYWKEAFAFFDFGI